MQQDPVLEAMRDRGSHIDLSTLPVSHIILGQPLRNYFIKRVKEPFVKFIVWIGRKYPDPDKHSTSGQMDTTLRYVLDRLVKYNKEARQDFFEASRRIILDEAGHDSFERDRILACTDYLLESLLDGDLLPRQEGRPDKMFWTEPAPYGGKYSMIHKIREHRKEINALIGRMGKEDLNAKS